MGCVFHKWKEWTINVTKNGVGFTRKFLRLCLKCDRKERVTDNWLLAPSTVPNSLPIPGLTRGRIHCESLTDEEFHEEIRLFYGKKSEE
jgi:hypothetical protein